MGEHQLAYLGASAESFAGEEDQSVDGQEDRRRRRFREDGAEVVLEHEPDDADRDRSDYQQPRHPLGRRVDVAFADRGEESR